MNLVQWQVSKRKDEVRELGESWPNEDEPREEASQRNSVVRDAVQLTHLYDTASIEIQIQN